MVGERHNKETKIDVMSDCGHFIKKGDVVCSFELEGNKFETLCYDCATNRTACKYLGIDQNSVEWQKIQLIKKIQENMINNGLYSK